jgi:predicted negative regulator of RcsB-dependent stress response
MAQRHVFEPEQQPEPDPFTDAVRKAMAYAGERTVPLAFVGLIIALLAVGGVWYVNYLRNRGVEAFVRMHQAQAAYDKAVQARGEEQAKEFVDAVKKLVAVQGAESSVRARYLHAQALLQMGQPDGAANLFQEIAKPSNGVVGLLAQTGYGAALEQKKDWPGAAAAYADAALAPFRDIAGYDYALSEALFGRARVAREMGKPEEARAAYEEISRRHADARNGAIAARQTELARKARAFLTRAELAPTGDDLNALARQLDTWVQDTLRKPLTQRERVGEALDLLRDVEAYLKALHDARVAETEGEMDRAGYAYAAAVGSATVVPTREQDQRARLELERLRQMTAQRAPLAPPKQ